jgi:predicted secreted protein
MPNRAASSTTSLSRTPSHFMPIPGLSLAPLSTVRRNTPWALGATLLLAAGALGLANSSQASETPPLQGVVNLNASASAEVAKDWIVVAFNTTREGNDAATVQAELKKALDAALAEARRVAKPGQVELQTGNFSLSPRYTNKGVTNGWRGTAELVVEGRDMVGIGQLSGRISSLSIARVGYDLSREQRQKSESDITAQAIASYRAKAAEVTRQFGYGSYVVREVNLSSNEPQGYSPMVRAKAMSAPMADTEALPIEAGKAVVTVSVNGSVQMLK